MVYQYTVPFNGNHSSIVVGKKGRCITNLKEEFGVEITSKKPNKQNGMILPFFLIEGDERNVHMAALRIYSLLSTSQARTEKTLRTDNAEMINMLSELDLENEELKMKCSTLPFPPPN